MQPTKMIVLKYKPEVKLPSYNTADEKYVALDYSSGGCPIRANGLRAHNFKTVEAAQQYGGKEFDIVELTILVTENQIV